MNTFVLHAAEPVVVDTGLSLPDRGFMDALGSAVGADDVRWIWLTHRDRDHTGALFELLAAAPGARVVTTFLGAGIMSAERPLPMDRVHLLDPGQSLDVGGRTPAGFRPPLSDDPATVGFFDTATRTCSSSDCFGAPVPSAGLATCDDGAAVPADGLRAGQLLRATVSGTLRPSRAAPSSRSWPSRRPGCRRRARPPGRAPRRGPAR